MRSREKDRRTVHVFVDKKQSPLFFYGLPESVKFGVLFSPPGWIEFESFEELRESSVVAFEGGYEYTFSGKEVLSGEPEVPLLEQFRLNDPPPVVTMPAPKRRSFWRFFF